MFQCGGMKMIVEGMRRWLLRETVLIEEHHKPACLF